MSRADVLTLAESLAVRIRERAAECEAGRRVPEATIRELVESKLLRLLYPARYGGLEQDFEALLDTTIALGRYCPSTAWVYAVLAGHGWLASMFDEQAQKDIWGTNPDALIGSVLTPSSRAQPTADGYRVTGTAPLSSGIDYAHWVVAGGRVKQEGAPTEVRQFLIPRSDFEIIDDWHVSGLKGTGSKSVAFNDVFVPAHRTVSQAALREAEAPGSVVHDGSLYKMPLLVMQGSLATAAVAAAIGAFEWWTQATIPRTLNTGIRAAEHPPIRIHAAECSVEIDAARMLLAQDFREMLEVARSGARQPLLLRARMARDASYAVKICAQALDRMMASTGSKAIHDDGLLQRAWRDVRAMGCHFALTWDNGAELYGARLFETAWKGTFY
jgi:3-hydroxy-9,10-secoandrosta-1,3,5(10)-triene-9,17-dione monooxygenase